MRRPATYSRLSKTLAPWIVRMVFGFMVLCQGAHAQQADQGSNEPVVCERASLDKLKLSAQALSDETEELGEALRQCTGYQDEVLLWLGFYYRNRGDYDKASALRPMDSDATLSDRDGVFAEARAGQTKDLLARIDTKLDGWHQDAEAQLVLSRALARSLKFDRSRQAYDDYLALKPDDSEIRVESHYLYLWEGNCAAALSRFKEFLELPLASQSPASRESASRGLAQASKCLVTQPPGAAAALLKLPQFVVGYSYMQTSDDFAKEFTYSRFTIAPSLRTDWIEIGFRSHRMVGTFLEGRETRLGTEVYARHRWVITEQVELAAQAGVYVADKARAQGQAMATWSPGAIRLGTDVALIPIAPELRTPPEWRNARRISYGASIGYKNTLKYRAERKQIESFEPSMSHALTGRQAIGDNNKNTIQLYIEDERFEGNNTLFYSPKQLTHGTLGIEHRNFLFGLAVRIYGDYGLYQQDLHEEQQGDRYEPSSGTMYTIELGTEGALFKELYGQLSARLRDVQNQKGLTTYRELKALASVNWEIP